MARRVRPRLGIVAKLAAVSLILLAIPLLTLRYQQQTHDFVLDGQRNALQLAAEAVATVLHGREDLFSESGGLPFSPWDDPQCSALPLEAPVRLDGNGRDWPNDPDHTCRYQRGNSDWNDAGATVAFDLTLGQREGYLYALFEVHDDDVLLRDPRYRNLDGSDHLRVTVPERAGDERRYVITAEEPGSTSAYEVGEGWRYARGEGLPVLPIRGSLQKSPEGYTVEMRIPVEMLPRKQIGFAVADADDSVRSVSVVAVTPGIGSGRIHLVLLDSPEIERILRGLHLPGAKISVIDERRRVRAEVGAVPDAEGDPHRERLLEVALEDGAGASESGEATTAASSPIRIGERVVGAVLIEQANDRILALPRRALERERNAIIGACVAIAGVFWLFAWRLTWRIRRLRDEAGDVIDANGRVREIEVRAGRDAGDEVGDVSRTVSALLARLARYTTFLEQVPSTLRHELSNPLNTLSMSLQNLVGEHPELVGSKYMKSAERGVARIGEIVESLTEAASLEEALRHEDLEPVDLTDLVRGYIENFASGCPERRFTIHGADESIPIFASGFRIEQLLDKLVDNAVAFSPEDSEIEIAVTRSAECARLRIANEGPLIPREIQERLFESMFSTRGPHLNGQPHLGIGLYVVRLIVERLGGKVEVGDQAEGRGPAFSVEFPTSEDFGERAG
jgi:two-component system sensor histidine kinase ChvG